MNRVSDGDRSTSLSFLSCGALQRRRDRRYSEGASSVRPEWHAVGPHEHLNTREAVILVPDPIAFAPGQAL